MPEILISICDDDAEFGALLCDKIKRSIPSECEIEVFTKGKSLLQRWIEKPGDVVFLDIDMPGLDGFEIAEKLNENNSRPIIIFVTNHDEDVYSVWKYKPFWFLRKSHIDELPDILTQMCSEIESRLRNSKESCLLKCEDRVVEINFNRVLTVESFKHNIIVENIGSQLFKARCRIADAEVQLRDYHIVRVQRGILVNLRFVSKVTSNAVILQNGRIISIGRERVSQVRSQYQRFLREV